MSTRRKFIRDCSALAATAAVLPVAAFANEPGTPLTSTLEQLDFPVFAALLRSQFRLHSAQGAAQTLELIQAELSPGWNRSGELAGGGQFSLLFRGDAAKAVSQDTYQLEHSHLGKLVMFLAPVGRQRGRFCHYEAVFNRLAPTIDLAAVPTRRNSKVSHG